MSIPIVLTEAPEIAARYGVAPDIHAADFMFSYHLASSPDRRADVIGYYFSDGAHSAAQLDSLIARLHPGHGQRQLSLLEFASGYGMVSRHLANMGDRYTLDTCDIHPEAVAFLNGQMGVNALLSHRDPAQLVLPRRYDVIFALSFFTHIRAWPTWMLRLFDAVADDGVLIFTTHGRIEHCDGGAPPLDSDGFWFGGTSEQKDLPLDDYRTVIVTPPYVIGQMERRENATLAMFEESLWWGRQDTYAIRRSHHPFAREMTWPVLRDEVEAIRRSTSWRLTGPLRRAARLLRRE